jgi:spore germination protein KB
MENMIEKGKISAFQMAIMMTPTIFATALLLVPAATARHAKQDLWLSPIMASVSGFLVVMIAAKLYKLYPEKSFIQYCELILGKIAGKIVGLIFLAYLLHINGIILREYAEFVVGTFLHLTPMNVVMGSMLLVCALAVYGGIEAIARSSQIIVPVVTLLFVLMTLLLLKDLDIKNLQPFLEDGLLPPFMGSIVPAAWFSEFILIAFLLPYLKDSAKAMKWGFLSVGSVAALLVLTNLATYMLLGKLTIKDTYPVMVAVRYISIAGFLEHLEAIVMAIWVSGTFIKIAVFYYAAVLGLAQLLGLSVYQPLVLPTAFLLLGLSNWSASNLQSLAHFLETTGAFYLLTMQLGVPFLLLCIAWIRKSFMRKRMESNESG